MINLDYRSRVPIYDQIVNGIIKLRSLGALSADDKLPSVRQLAAELHINPNTVQRAYATLEAEGVIYSISGKGSFISGDTKANEAMRTAAMADFTKAAREAFARGLDRNTLLSLIEEAELNENF